MFTSVRCRLVYHSAPPPYFQVHLAGIKTCLFSDETCALPSVWLCLLDFEPLIFDGLQRKQGGPSHYAHSNINEDGQGGPPPFVFPCNKGKSCFFEADPARLSQDLRLPGALTLMVVSKLSKRQVLMRLKGVEPNALPRSILVFPLLFMLSVL